MTKFSTKITLDGIEVFVEGTYYKGDPGRWSMPNGDPGWPLSGDEVYFKWWCKNNEDAETLILDYGSMGAVDTAIEEMILQNPDRYV